ncbi:MAG: hypothetical protein NTZ27_12295 [Ignavibacteriales bacterium]|nr:hypothetical protein [Ignavibacteriales bacterium]
MTALYMLWPMDFSVVPSMTKTGVTTTVAVRSFRLTVKRTVSPG